VLGGDAHTIGPGAGPAVPLRGVKPNPYAPEALHEASRTATLQGVLVTQRYKDGAAFLLAQPRFHHYCGTCKRRSGVAGYQHVLPLNEFLVANAYADPDPDAQPALTDEQRRRLLDAQLARWDVFPNWTSAEGRSFSLRDVGGYGVESVEKFREHIALGAECPQIPLDEYPPLPDAEAGTDPP